MGSEATFSFKAQNWVIKLSAIFCKNSSNLNLANIIDMNVKIFANISFKCNQGSKENKRNPPRYDL